MRRELKACFTPASSATTQANHLLAGIHPINCCRILAAASQATSTMYEVVGCTVPKISDLISLLIAWFRQFIKKSFQHFFQGYKKKSKRNTYF